MDTRLLNELLCFIRSDYVADDLITESGQRKVYLARRTGSADRFVLKTCPLHPIAVLRIKREIKILGGIDSRYFPKFYFQFFVTDEVLQLFLESFDPKTQQARIKELEAMNLRPFLVTVEEHIDHVEWESCASQLREERALVEFLIHLFMALKLLWDQKIVHRDLKPENILVRPTLEPVIIDLGIAKSMSDGATIITNPAFPSPCTPRFAAPEQLTNNKAEVTYKSDQFAVGVMAFLVLTGVLPYGNEADIGVETVVHNCLSQKVESFRKYNTAASDGLVRFVERLLKPQPYQRFRTADEILNALTELKGAT